ncbi:MAG: aspartate 1-decarboxylase [Candidatus Melainabacteria bacterium]|nr:aspartate 1-decarboxylase [Candidatus Melainabacteria bacterium]
MLRTFLKSKIHRATVTKSNLNYIGSLTIDSYLMELANIKEYEQIQVLNITNGERLITYAISGSKNSGTICVNGAASHKIKTEDIVIIVSYAQLNEEEVKNFKPKIIHVDKNNIPDEVVVLL